METGSLRAPLPLADQFVQVQPVPVADTGFIPGVGAQCWTSA